MSVWLMCSNKLKLYTITKKQALPTKFTSVTVIKIINTIISYNTNGIDTVGLNIQLDTL